MVDQAYGSTVADFRDQLGLPRLSAWRMRRRRTDAQWPILHGFSSTVVPRPNDWRPGLEVTGYWWPRLSAGWQPPSDLLSFLEAGPPPVYIGLGSLMLSAGEAAAISETIGRALTATGVRGIIGSGGAGLKVLGDNVITVETVPHEWLFGKVAAVAHSCGAGTTAAGLRAGLPTVAIPSPGGDQPFWAKRLRELGVSPAAIPRPRLTVERLARALDTALNEPGHRSAAEELAVRIRAEDGAGQVVDTVEQLVGA